MNLAIQSLLERDCSCLSLSLLLSLLLSPLMRFFCVGKSFAGTLGLERAPGETRVISRICRGDKTNRRELTPSEKRTKATKFEASRPSRTIDLACSRCAFRSLISLATGRRRMDAGPAVTSWQYIPGGVSIGYAVSAKTLPYTKCHSKASILIFGSYGDFVAHMVSYKKKRLRG